VFIINTLRKLIMLNVDRALDPAEKNCSPCPPCTLVLLQSFLKVWTPVIFSYNSRGENSSSETYFTHLEVINEERNQPTVSHLVGNNTNTWPGLRGPGWPGKGYWFWKAPCAACLNFLSNFGVGYDKLNYFGSCHGRPKQ